MIATNTTRLLVTRTARLRTLARQVDPFTATAVAVLCAVLGVGLATPRPTPAPVAVPALQPVVSRADGRPRIAHQVTHRAAPAAAHPLPTAVIQLATAAPAPVAVPVEQQITVQQVAPTAAAWVADPQIVQTDAGSVSTFDPPADAVRYCTGFGDWRDYDAMYVSSPSCQAVAP